MRCNRCGNEVPAAKFCARCGGLLGSRCASCGTILKPGQKACGSCGALVGQGRPQNGGQQNNQPQNGGQQQSNGANDGGMQVQALKKRSKALAVKKNPAVKVRGILGALGCLSALGVFVYFLMFEQFISLNIDDVAVAVSPFMFSADTLTSSLTIGEFVLFENLDYFTTYFETMIASFSTLFGGEDIFGSIGLLVSSLPAIMFQVMFFLSMVFAVIALLYGIIRLLVGFATKKEFDLLATLGLVLLSLLAMYLSISFMYGWDSVSLTCGLMISIYACLGAFAFQVILNLVLANTRFVRAGSIMKWITNGGFIACALLMFFYMPMTFIDSEGVEFSPLAMVAYFISNFTAILAEGEFMSYLYYITLVLYQLWMIVTLSSSVVKTSKRFARTFKFDGYEDVSYLKQGIAKVVLAGSIITFAMLAGGTLTSSLILFAIGGAGMLLVGLVNRVVLNKDQKR